MRTTAESAADAGLQKFQTKVKSAAASSVECLELLAWTLLLAIEGSRLYRLLGSSTSLPTLTSSLTGSAPSVDSSSNQASIPPPSIRLLYDMLCSIPEDRAFVLHPWLVTEVCLRMSSAVLY